MFPQAYLPDGFKGQFAHLIADIARTVENMVSSASDADLDFMKFSVGRIIPGRIIQQIVIPGGVRGPFECIQGISGGRSLGHQEERNQHHERDIHGMNPQSTMTKIL